MERLLRQKLLRKSTKVTAQRSHIMRAVRSHNNKSTELRFRSALIRARIRGWRIRPCKIVGHPDFYFPKYRIAIFVDGCFWHGCHACGHVPKSNRAFWATKIKLNTARDRRNAAILESKDITVLRFWEHDLRTNILSCIQRLIARFALTDGEIIS